MHKYLWLILSFFISFSGFSQTAKPGVKAGVNISLIDEYDQVTSPMASFHAGFYFEMIASERVIVQPEILYSVQGAKLGTGDESLVFNYFNVPVGIKLYPDKDLSSGFYFQVGPQIGVLMSAYKKDGDSHSEVKSGMNTIDIAALFGFGLDITDHIGISARYNRSLTNASKSYLGIYHNRVIQVSLQYLF